MKALHVQHFSESLQEIDPQFQTKKYLIAISGGVDSVVLAHLFKELNLNHALAHVNYQLRGEDSDLDQQFCRKLAAQNEIPFYNTTFDTHQLKKPQESIQMLCRRLRYDYFHNLQSEYIYDYIVTAHHADDGLETSLLNLMRGSGIKGLTGIPKVNKNIIRPLLPFSKKEILCFAQENKLQWREDVSNSKNEYDRNFVRNEVLTLLKQRNPQIPQNIQNSISHLKEIAQYIENQMVEKKNTIFEPYKEGYKISTKEISKLADFEIHEILFPYGFSSATEIRKLLQSQTGAVLKSNAFALHKDREAIYLLPLLMPETKAIKIEEIPFESKGDLKLKLTRTSQPDPNALGVLDAKTLKFPLHLRHRKEGDVFYPQKFTGSKKLSKFFKDEKIPNFEKDLIWLLTDADDQIIFVLPFKQDRRFEIGSNTQEFINVYL